MIKKIITALIVLAAAVLFWAANLLVANLNIAELLKQLHGG
jgi:hypothetical protein